MGAITQISGGKFADWMDGNRDALARAVTFAVDAAAKGAQGDFRQDLGRTNYKQMLGNLIGEGVFPRGGKASVAAAAMVSSRGELADKVLGNLVDGRAIMAKRGKFMAIPTGYNRPSGRRGGAYLISPAQMIASGHAFVTRSKHSSKGAYVWYLKVEGVTPYQGKRGITALAGGMLKVGSSAKRARHLIKRGAVPMFVLIPMVLMPKIFNADGTMEKWVNAVPELIERALPKG